MNRPDAVALGHLARISAELDALHAHLSTVGGAGMTPGQYQTAASESYSDRCDFLMSCNLSHLMVDMGLALEGLNLLLQPEDARWEDQGPF